MKLGLIISSVSNLLIIIMLMQNEGSCNACLESERIGLLEIKYYFVSHKGADPFNYLSSWVDDRDSNCCNWNRVKCSNTSSGHITELSLYFSLYDSSDHMIMMNVSLFRPFQELSFLDLSLNKFEGWTDNEGFPRLQKLETLDLSYNNLNNTSSILSSLNGLTALKTLYLRDNLIDSFSAEGFLRSKELEILDLSYNSLNCSILTSLHGFTALRSLTLSYNDNFNCSLSALDFLKFNRLKLLDLAGNQLGGFLHVEDVQNLKNFKFLNLRETQMSGSIEGLCQLKDLVELDISKNMFGGKLPECLSNLTNLRVLDVGSNSFSGPFPSFTTNLTSLGYLSLDGNYMNGSFSLSTLANHSNLQILHISSQSTKAHIETENTKWFPTFQLISLILRNCNLNMDKGNVFPTFLSSQYHLMEMDLSGNKLVGSFPSWLIHNRLVSSSIEYLDISNNKLSGLLPKDIGIFLHNVTTWNISWNSFEGNIPSSIGKMKNLVSMDFSHNHFSGELPKQLATDCDSLNSLMLSNNFISGTLEDVLGNNNSRLVMLDISNNSISGTIPSSIGMFSYMKVLSMSENLLEGEIPIEISNMSSLQVMDLSQNKLIGSIPKFTNIKSLSFLYLEKNDLSGSIIPFDLSGSSQLKLLDLTDNNFSGKIPSRINKLAELRVLLLGGNNLEGAIPTQLCRLKKINMMDLSRNMLNSSIPSCFQNLSFGQYDDGNGPIFEIPGGTTYVNSYPFNSSLKIGYLHFNLFDSHLVHLEAEFRTKHVDYFYKGKVLEIMTGLDLSCNNLTGIIPFQIGNFISLNLSHNYLSGPIPNTFSNFTRIESLDLSYNKLSGEIPSQLTQLNFLSTFNVSYNNLSGTPPSTGQFATFDEKSYKGNPGLCGPFLNRKCQGIASSPSSQSNIDSGEKETNVDMISFYWSFIASYITILLAFITVLCINPRWRMAWFYYISKLMRTCFPNFPLY